MSKATLRRDLARACKKQGLLIQPAAMTAWLKECESGDSKAAAREMDLLLQSLKEMLSQKTGGSSSSTKLITLALFQEAMEKASSSSSSPLPKVERHAVTFSKTTTTTTTSESDDDEEPTTQTATRRTTSSISSKSTAKTMSTISIISPTPSWRLVSAFDTPKLVYDAMRQQFRYDDDTSNSSSNKSLMGTAQDLIDMRTQRYSLVHQRVVRHRQQKQEKSLMTIDRLLGSNNSSSSSSAKTVIEHVLLGMLRSNPSNGTGCFLELEDLTGSIPLKINLEENTTTNSASTTTTTMEDDDEQNMVTQLDPRGIYMDGSMVLAHGTYLENEVFSCNKLEFPPLENPEATKQHLPPSPYMDVVMDSGLADGESSMASPMTLYCMGNLELDDPDCLEQLEAVVERMKLEDTDGTSEGSILALFGNFVTNTLKLSSALEEIANILQNCNLPRNHSVLILPGPRDVLPNGCWPLPALDKHIVPLSLREMDNVHFCSSPCRLELKDGRSILLIRKDMIRESLQNQILSVDTDKINSKSLSLDRRVLHHMLSQGHIMPASTSTTLQPIYWNFDHAMRLVPLPDLIVAGLDSDYAEEGLEFRRAGCRILAPPCRGDFQNWVKVTLDGSDDDMDVEMGGADSDAYL